MKFKEVQLPSWIAETGFKKCWARPNEPLYAHFIATREYFLKLCDGGLESIIDKQIEQVFSSDRDAVKQLIIDMITFHDIGKINPAFQKIKLGNPAFFGSSDSDTTHSEYGWILFSLLKWKDINKFKDNDDFVKALILTTTIAGHHTFAWGTVDQAKLSEIKNNVEKALSFSKVVKLNVNDLEKKEFIYRWKTFSDDYSQDLSSQELFSLYKTIYSALILSDSNAVSEKERGTPALENTITASDVAIWRKAFSESERMNSIESNARRLERMSPGEVHSVNDLRSKIFLEATKNFEEGLNSGHRVFYLEAPTGSGKTNCSINLMLRALELKPSLKRAFFVFPFINLIEQNIDVINRSIAAQDGDLLEVHSLAEWNDEDEYKLKQEYDERLFLNSKITILSSVNFFEALGSSRKVSNYKICNLSNSVIVVDELQSVDDKLWTYFQFLLESFAKANNCYIVLMSATLPRIDRINAETDTIKPTFFELLPDANTYQANPCFKTRTHIIFKDKIQTVESTINLLEDLLKQRSYPTKCLVVVNTVKRSKELYTAIPAEFETVSGTHRFKKYLLNSELLPHKKREIIAKAKSKGQDMILVSTQCIEAGVDADFDIGIRDYAIPDSVEQVAGRINREGIASSRGELYIINLHESEKSDAEKIYGHGRRWETCEYLGVNSVRQIFDSRDYSEYYTALIELIKSKNKKLRIYDIDGRSQMEDALALRLHSDKIKNFRAIHDDCRENCFIMTELPESAFRSKAELKFIREKIGSLKNGKISGRSVWDAYSRFKENAKREDFLKRILFTSIISKFIASRRPQGRPSKQLIPIEDLTGVYDLDRGFEGSENIF